MSNQDDYESEEQAATGEAPDADALARVRTRRRLRLAVRLSSFALTAGFIALALLVLVTIPKLQRDIETGPAVALAVTVLDADGSEIGSRGGSSAPIVPLTELPPYLVKAFVATEDRRFYSHFGIDLRGIARAAWVNLRSGSLVEGGSTITQQLAKNLYLDSDRTLWRKSQEALIALWLESHYTKDEILTLYLNRVYMGAGNYGIDAAAHYYFGKSARDVSLAEAAVLAGLPKAPSRFAPTNDLALAQARAGQVLDRMVDNGDLTAAEVADARAHPALVADRDTRDGPQYFVDWVTEQVRTLLPGAQGRVTVKTTLDPKRQRAAENAVRTALASDGAKRDIGQGAFIALGRDGAVLAMVGGKSYLQSQFNRAVQAERQPGSAFKPVVYLAALEQGFTPSSEFEDSPVALGEWAPQNSNNRYAGTVTLTEALARSINTVAVKLAERVGVKAIADAAQRLGISSPVQDNLSIALGSSEVNLLELTSAYSTFATDGQRVLPYGISEITSATGDTLYKYAPAPAQQATAVDHARDMTYMLRHVITSGTGLRADLGIREAAGKTGTSQDNRDAWFIGYTANETAGVWFGNDDNSGMKNVSGGNFAAMAWRNYMLASQVGVPVAALPGADAETRVADRGDMAGPLKGFLSQLSDLFSVAPRVAPRETSGWGSGFRRGNENLAPGGGRPN